MVIDLGGAGSLGFVAADGLGGGAGEGALVAVGVEFNSMYTGRDAMSRQMVCHRGGNDRCDLVHYLITGDALIPIYGTIVLVLLTAKLVASISNRPVLPTITASRGDSAPYKCGSDPVTGSPAISFSRAWRWAR